MVERKRMGLFMGLESVIETSPGEEGREGNNKYFPFPLERRKGGRGCREKNGGYYLEAQAYKYKGCLWSWFSFPFLHSFLQVQASDHDHNNTTSTWSVYFIL